MRQMAYFFFYTYIGLVIVAGFWGAFVNPSWDFRKLFSLDMATLPPNISINILSQYRFLRALELGFGIFSVLYVKEIFSVRRFWALFSLIMGFGILARIASWLVDGNPNMLTKFFLFYEAMGWVVIFIYGTRTIVAHGTGRN